MMTRQLVAALTVFIALCGPLTGPALSEPVSTLAELWGRFGACSQVTHVPSGAEGSEVTVLFALKRDGSLLGKPRVTHSQFVGDDATQHAFLAAALADLAGCFPLEITDGLGGAVAGRPFRLRLVSRKPERRT
jgi:hypothetical protein